MHDWFSFPTEVDHSNCSDTARDSYYMVNMVKLKITNNVLSIIFCSNFKSKLSIDTTTVQKDVLFKIYKIIFKCIISVSEIFLAYTGHWPSINRF